MPDDLQTANPSPKISLRAAVRKAMDELSNGKSDNAYWTLRDAYDPMMTVAMSLTGERQADRPFDSEA